MTSARTDSAPQTRAPITPAVVRAGAVTSVVALLSLLVAYFVSTPWKSEGPGDWSIDSDKGASGLLWIVGFVALSAIVVFGVVVRRAMAADVRRTARTSWIVAVVGVLSLPVFWTGLPIFLGSAAALLGLDVRSRLGRLPVPAAIGIGLGVLVTIVGVVFCLSG